MMKRIKVFTVILLLLGSNSAIAGSIIEVQSGNERITVLTDGKLARMNMAGDEYVVVDYKQQTVKIVSPKKQQVLLLNANEMDEEKAAAKIRVSIKKLGAGVEIAGYPTEKYVYSANGKACGIVFGSKDVYQKDGIKELFQAMDTMMEKQQAVLGDFAGLIDDCTLADMQLSNQIEKLGVPMRTEKNGRVETEIKSIKYGAALPANAFVIPTSYQVVNVQNQIKAATKNMAEMQKQLQQLGQQPEVQEMMKQMQQSGQITPEMMQQMQQAEEMMKQSQQQ